MKISSKGRYALLAMTYLASKKQNDTYISVLEISQEFSISKIYLEQVFALLKKANLLIATKGSSGGYKLNLPASDITVFDILKLTENTIFEQTENTLEVSSLYEQTFLKLLYDPLDQVIQTTLTSITLEDLVNHFNTRNLMFYI